MSYAVDRKWSDQCLDVIRDVLTKNTIKFLRIRLGTDAEDMAECGDFKIEVESGFIAARVRRADCRHRDFTIRSRRDSGAETELAKIRSGKGSRYVYAWVSGMAYEYIIVNLNKARNGGLFDVVRTDIPNGDGTYFVAIPLRELHAVGALLGYSPSLESHVRGLVAS